MAGGCGAALKNGTGADPGSMSITPTSYHLPPSLWSRQQLEVWSTAAVRRGSFVEILSWTVCTRPAWNDQWSSTRSRRHTYHSRKSGLYLERSRPVNGCDPASEAP